MNTVYISIQRVIGLIGLPGGTDFELLNPKPHQARAFLTMERDPYFLHLRRCAAYGKMIAQALTNSVSSSLSAPERFAAALASVIINEDLKSDRPLLIIESTSMVEPLPPGRQTDMGTCCLGLRLFDQTAVAKVALAAGEAVISSIALILPSGTTPTVEAVGTVAYAIEPGTGRYIYSLEPSASASMTSMTSVTVDRLSEASTSAQRLLTDSDLQTVVHLLSRSLQTTDDLQAFLTAWAGLEVFLDKSFEAYKPKIYAQMKSGITRAARPFVDRLQKVIEEEARYNVRDKFLVVSSCLSAGDSEHDMALFRSVKETRDSIHVMKLQSQGYPTFETQNLLRKYLQLHLLTRT